MSHDRVQPPLEYTGTVNATGLNYNSKTVTIDWRSHTHLDQRYPLKGLCNHDHLEVGFRATGHIVHVTLVDHLEVAGLHGGRSEKQGARSGQASLQDRRAAEEKLFLALRPEK